MIALFVTLDVRPDRRDDFLAAITAQGAASLEREPGCLHFDVCEDTERPNRFLLYEVYADQAAFDAHGQTPHFAVWSEARERCVASFERTLTRIAFSATA